MTGKYGLFRGGFLALLVLFFPIGARAASYTPPLEASTPLTSTFAEFRGDHFHNGIDFTTNGQLGRPVHAVDAGTVHRVFYDPARYGKTVILEHKDGRRTWYSHLNAVPESIRDRLQGPLLPNQDVTFDSRMPIPRGGIVGYSGNTGRGPAHLHFALQSSDGTFLNPIGRFNPSLTYRPDPFLDYVRFLPLSGEAWIDGSGSPRRFDDVPRRPVELWGEIGFDLSVYNNHTHNNNTSLPAEIVLKRDGSTIRAIRFNELSRQQQKTGLWSIYNGRLSNLSPTRFTLHLTPYESRNHWEGVRFENDGETGQLTIVLRTRTGNQRQYTIPYEVVPPPAPINWENRSVRGQGRRRLESIRAVNSNYRLASLERAQFARQQYSPPSYEDVQNPQLSLDTRWRYNRLRITVEVENRWTGWPALRVSKDGFEKSLPLMQVEPGRFVSWWSPNWDRDGWYRITSVLPTERSTVKVQEEVYLQSLQVGKPAMILSLDRRYSVFSQGTGLNESFFMNVKTAERKPIREGLRYVETPRKISPSIVKSSEELEVTVDVSEFENLRRIGIFQWDPLEQRWGKPSYKTGITQSIRVADYKQPGTIALVRDTAKPRIESPYLSEDGTRVIFPVHENGSGIDPSTLEVSRGETLLPAAWEADENRIIVPLHDVDADGRSLQVSVRDRAGNRTLVREIIKTESP